MEHETNQLNWYNVLNEQPKSPLKYSGSYMLHSPGKTPGVRHLSSSSNNIIEDEKQEEAYKLTLTDENNDGKTKATECPTPEKYDSFMEPNQILVEQEQERQCSSPTRRRTSYPTTIFNTSTSIEMGDRLLYRKYANRLKQQELQNLFGAQCEEILDAYENDEELQDIELLRIKYQQQQQQEEERNLWTQYLETIDACEEDLELEDTELMKMKWHNAMKRKEYETSCNSNETIIDTTEDELTE